jgi:hypothetical protein
MQLTSTSRTARVRRVLAATAAAAAVIIGPTACDYGAFGGGSTDTSFGDSGTGHVDHSGVEHAGHGQQPVVVPVGNTVDATPDADPDADPADAERDGRDWDRRYGRDGRDGQDGDGRGDGDDEQPAATTEPASPAATDTVVPVGNAPADTGAPDATAPPTTTAAPTESAAPTAAPAPTENNGLDVLGRDCTNSNLAPHDGFQKSPACVSTAMGEVAAEDRLPSLLITAAPETVGVNQPFKLEVSTRNLVRDRFLGAAAGGYYLESSFLDGNGLQRGHFHTACRLLASTNEAPDSGKAPEFFLATQDNKGGAAPDTVTIEVPATATKTAGEMQCTSWAGDGSHRTPMMTKANETPAIDSVRITIAGDAPAVQNDVNNADVQADADAQAKAQGEEAAAQKPDQDGAPQPGAFEADTAAPAAPAESSAPAETAAPADTTAPVETDAADPAPTTAPAGN